VQREKQIQVDGNLEEWTKFEEIALEFSPEGRKIEPSRDIQVMLQFSFDEKNFYLAVKAIDDIFDFQQSGWKYGDGIYLTFVEPSKGNEGENFISFGIWIEGNKETMVVVNRNGEYFPHISLRDARVKAIADYSQRMIFYEISIPWKEIIPFRPFINQKYGINLVYVDSDKEEREVLQLEPDPDYDSENSRKRRGLLFDFMFHFPEEYEFQASLNGTHFYMNQERILTLAINSFQQASGWQLKYILTSARGNVSSEKEISLKEGLNLYETQLGGINLCSGSHLLSVGVIDEQKSLRYAEDFEFYLVDREELERFERKILEAKGSEAFLKDERFKESLPTLEIRLEWIREFMESPSRFSDIRELKNWFEEVDLLLKNVEEKKPALFPEGSVVRLAYRSKLDGTLQPYSILIPFNYDSKTPIPLFMTLHPSGMDESKALNEVASAFFRTRGVREGLNFIIVSPKARSLSDWYLGDSGEEVLECLKHVSKLYNIDKKNMVLDGFAMGGYGAWRLALLNPGLFKALIIRSAPISPPDYLKGENILDLLEKGKGFNVFVIHGIKDRVVPVEQTRRVVEKLKELGINHRYLELKDASHGGYDAWKEIFNWLKLVVKREKGKREKIPFRTSFTKISSPKI